MKFLLVSLLLIFASSNVFAEEIEKKSKEVNTANPNDQLFYNISFGVSAFECMLGVEIQKGSHSIGLGGTIPKKRLTESYMRIKKVCMQGLESAIGGSGYLVGM